MIDNVGSRSVTSPIAKPLLADVAHHNASWVVKTAILASISRKNVTWGELFFFIFKLMMKIYTNSANNFYRSNRIRMIKRDTICKG